MYRVQEFAGLAGVTVRALHHYDHLGLLKPLRNGRTGYRLYRDSDFARLEQIVVLKFLGVPLRDIGPLLKTRNLRDVVQRQRHVLLERRQQIDSAMRAIQKVEHALDSAETPDWKVFTSVVKEISMQNDTTWTKKYYSDSAQAKVEARRAMWSPELQELVGPTAPTGRRARPRASACRRRSLSSSPARAGSVRLKAVTTLA
jgi:DNA-binding transcriptional MerR regulator